MKFKAPLGIWGKKGKIMAKITLAFGSTGETVPVNDVDLGSVTNTEILTSAVSGGILPGLGTDMEYKMISKTNMPITESATLALLGFVDGDTIKVVAKPVTYGAPLADSITDKPSIRFSDVIVKKL